MSAPPIGEQDDVAELLEQPALARVGRAAASSTTRPAPSSRSPTSSGRSAQPAYAMVRPCRGRSPADRPVTKSAVHRRYGLLPQGEAPNRNACGLSCLRIAGRFGCATRSPAPRQTPPPWDSCRPRWPRPRSRFKLGLGFVQTPPREDQPRGEDNDKKGACSTPISWIPLGLGLRSSPNVQTVLSIRAHPCKAAMKYASVSRLGARLSVTARVVALGITTTGGRRRAAARVRRCPAAPARAPAHGHRRRSRRPYEPAPRLRLPPPADLRSAPSSWHRRIVCSGSSRSSSFAAVAALGQDAVVVG